MSHSPLCNAFFRRVSRQLSNIVEIFQDHIEQVTVALRLMFMDGGTLILKACEFFCADS